MKALKFVLVAAALSVSVGCASTITSIEPVGGSKFILTGQEQVPFSGLKGFVWEGEYDPATRVMKVRKQTRVPW